MGNEEWRVMRFHPYVYHVFLYIFVHYCNVVTLAQPGRGCYLWSIKKVIHKSQTARIKMDKIIHSIIWNYAYMYWSEPKIDTFQLKLIDCSTTLPCHSDSGVKGRLDFPTTYTCTLHEWGARIIQNIHILWNLHVGGNLIFKVRYIY